VQEGGEGEKDANKGAKRRTRVETNVDVGHRT